MILALNWSAWEYISFHGLHGKLTNVAGMTQEEHGG